MFNIDLAIQMSRERRASLLQQARQAKLIKIAKASNSSLAPQSGHKYGRLLIILGEKLQRPFKQSNQTADFQPK